ncbi:unnamed protein product [Rhizophagus irregularis]|nr:unnamed protein product [Rhizophagus irregularis]
MDNKFISRDALRKRKARENETSSQRETRLEKQREITRQKRARENTNAEEREARGSRDKERKCVKLATETDEQHLNSQQQNLQQKSQDSGADGAEDNGAEDGAEDGADTHTDAGVLGEFERDLLKKFCNKVKGRVFC